MCLIKFGWLSKNYVGRFKSNPNKDLVGFRIDLIREICINGCDENEVYLAKKKGIKEACGRSCGLVSYIVGLCNYFQGIGIGSTMILGVTEDNRFDKFYAYLHTIKEGWMEGVCP